MQDIQNILNNDILSRFKVYQPATLFELDLSPIKQGRCPFLNCGNKLYTTTKGDRLCKGTKHPKFFMKKK